MRLNPEPTPFIAALKPLLDLGPDHPAVESLLKALDVDVKAMTENSCALGASADDRHWWAGNISHALEMRDEILAARERYRKAE